MYLIYVQLFSPSAFDSPYQIFYKIILNLIKHCNRKGYSYNSFVFLNHHKIIKKDSHEKYIFEFVVIDIKQTKRF